MTFGTGDLSAGRLALDLLLTWVLDNKRTEELNCSHPLMGSLALDNKRWTMK
jgi:hypothetical protein